MNIDKKAIPCNFESFVQNEISYWRVPGFSCAVIRGGRTVFLKGFGYRNVEKKLSFTAQTVAGIGSISKSMTTFVLAQLADEGKVDFDTPVHEYLPDFEMYDLVATRETTLRDILCHRTGLGGHDGTWPDNSISRTEYMHRLKYLKPNKPFRSVAQYSNVMFNVAGAIAERVSGQSWEELLTERIFKPLGMKHTYCTMEPASADPEIATPYEVINGKPCSRPLWNIDMAGPCGGVMSTAEDMSLWIHLQLADGVWNGKHLVSSNRFEEMHTPTTLMYFPDSVPYAIRLGYGLAWRVTSYFGHMLQHHAGKIGCYSAFQFYCKEADIGGFFMMNMHEPATELFFTLMYTLLDNALNLSAVDWSKALHTGIVPAESGYTKDNLNYMPKTAVPNTNPSHDLSAYCGTYWNNGYGKLSIYKENNNLFLNMRNIQHLPLTHFHYDVFQVDGIKEDILTITAPLSFITDTDTGTISKCTFRLEPLVDDIVYTKKISAP